MTTGTERCSIRGDFDLRWGASESESVASSAGCARPRSARVPRGLCKIEQKGSLHVAGPQRGKQFALSCLRTAHRRPRTHNGRWLRAR
jgi:hypothetical protein